MVFSFVSVSPHKRSWNGTFSLNMLWSLNGIVYRWFRETEAILLVTVMVHQGGSRPSPDNRNVSGTRVWSSWYLFLCDLLSSKGHKHASLWGRKAGSLIQQVLIQTGAVSTSPTPPPTRRGLRGSDYIMISRILRWSFVASNNITYNLNTSLWIKTCNSFSHYKVQCVVDVADLKPNCSFELFKALCSLTIKYNPVNEFIIINNTT